MSKITQTFALDFKDVLIKPKPTVVFSRKMVNLNRHLSFKHSTTEWEGVPFIVSNMDTTGTLEVHRVISEYRGLTALHKFYTVDDLNAEFERNNDVHYWNNVILSTGITDTDKERLDNILKEFP